MDKKKGEAGQREWSLNRPVQKGRDTGHTPIIEASPAPSFNKENFHLNALQLFFFC
jgi:hypothetical protein